MRYKIDGGQLPVVRIQLEPGETMISEAGGRTWAKGEVLTEQTSGGGAKKMFGRLLSGESMFLTRYTAQTAAEISFTSSFPGSIMAFELAPGQSIVAQKTAFLCATEDIELSIFFQQKLGSGFFGGEGFIMQKITGPGTAFIEIDGYCHEVELAPGEKIVCDTGVVAAMDETCTLEIERIKGVKNVLFGGEGLFDTVVRGPGKVYLQTMPIPGFASLISAYIPQS